VPACQIKLPEILFIGDGRVGGLSAGQTKAPGSRSQIQNNGNPSFIMRGHAGSQQMKPQVLGLLGFVVVFLKRINKTKEIREQTPSESFHFLEGRMEKNLEL
jgi:hypothetical protein